MTREKRSDIDRRQAMTILAGAAVAGAAPLWAAAPAVGPIGDTAYGKIRGIDRNGVKVFLGVPYGADTGGANRWLPPKPPAQWTGVKDCLSYGPLAPQSTTLLPPMKEEVEMTQQGPIDEDCLRFNLYTPAVGSASGRRAVMVWFHGGAFLVGSGSARSYDGTNLAKKQDVVLITVTHRLNHFGFLYLADLFGDAYADSGNVGMLDCLAVLQWIKANIANFGGDPNRVMIFGQAGGGAKVSTLMGMPAAKGLFHRAIVQSGSESQLSKEVAAANAKRLIDALGVKTLPELQALPWRRIVEVGTASGGAGGNGPVIDGRNLPAPPFTPPSSLHRDVPLITSTTETETASWAAPVDPIDNAALITLVTGFTSLSEPDATALISIYKNAYPAKENSYIGQLLTSQWNINHRVLDQTERKAEAGGAPVYHLYFAHHADARGGRLHSPHTGDIPYVFDSLASSTPLIGDVSPAEQALADKLSGYWANFAKTGNPNGAGLSRWEPFTLPKRGTLVVGTDDKIAMIDDPWGTTRKAIAEFRPRAK